MSRDVWTKKRANASGDNGWAERGGYMAAKISKLDEQFLLEAPREKQKQGTSSSIFTGVAVYVNGYTEPSADELRRLMMLHGGQFHNYYSRSKTTHIIANNLPNCKIQELKGEKIIRPEWITDSIKAGRLLPYLQYQLYVKQKASLFPAVTLRQTSEAAGPSRGSKPLPPPLPLPPPPSSSSCQNKSISVPVQPSPSDLRHRGASHSLTKPPHRSAPTQEVDLRLNGRTQTSPDLMSHSKTNQMQECVINNEAPPPHPPAPPLTNGHTPLLNGALSPHQDQSPEEKPQSPAGLDPYEFPHSPPKQNQPEAPSENTHPPSSSSSSSSSHPPVRLNGSHHHHHVASFSPDPPLMDQSASRSSTHLLQQTGGLISEYYSHSRLHQISTWRTGFSEYVNELHSKRKKKAAAGGAGGGGAGGGFPGRERLRKTVSQRTTQGQAGGVKSCIFHVDMDCFFVSVGIRHRPDLHGKPVAVTSNRGQGRVPVRPGANAQLEQQLYQRRHSHPQTEDELHRTPSQESPESHTNGVDQDAAALSMAEIASCSYEARQAGVRNGMFFGKAKQLCPSLQSVPYDFEAYKEVALSMYEVLASYTHDIEALSCDEVLIDASALLAELPVSPHDLAKAIRADIKEKTGCCASVGMGSNILLARLGTRKAKPNGQYHLRPEEVDDFIRDLPVTSLPGVGPVMGRKLAAMDVRTCGDLQQVALSQLQKKFGPRTGQTLFRFCRGLDDRPVRYEKERKSVSADMNYNIRFSTVDEAECFLTNLSMEVQRRLQEAGLRGRRVTLKLMVRKTGAPLEPAKYGGHGVCDNLAKTVLLSQSTDSGPLISSAVIKLLHAMKVPVQELRGVGIQVQLLEGTTQTARSIKDMLLGPRDVADQEKSFSSDPVPGTSSETPVRTQTPNRPHTARLNLSIEVPSPSQVDRSVLEALPPELRDQVEQSWMKRGRRPSSSTPGLKGAAHPARPASPPHHHLHPPHPPVRLSPPAGSLVLQIPNQPDSPGIVLELPNYSQVDPDVFAALPKELQEELKSAYSRVTNVQVQTRVLEQKNPLLQLKQASVGVGINRVKRRHKRKNAVSPVKKKTASPLKRRPAGSSPTKHPARETKTSLKSENVASTSKPDAPLPPLHPPPLPLRPSPALAGACDLTDIKTLLREWVTTITDPMEEDILQVVRYCTDLIEDKDLEKLDLIIKYMKRLMQQSVESVWSMAFDFIVDNVQVVVQQTYGSTLKIS